MNTITKSFSKRLVIPALLAENHREIYHIADLMNGGIDEIIINNDDLRNSVLELIKTSFNTETLPYGYSSHAEMIPYLLHPHSILSNHKDTAYIFFKQAPYFRRLNLSTGDSDLLPYRQHVDLDAIYSSTSNFDRRGNFYFTRSSYSQRVERYLNNRDCIEFAVYYYDSQTNSAVPVSPLCDGLLDNVHQVGYSSDEFLVILDMNLSVNGKLSSGADIYDDEFIRLYAGYEFPIGKIFIYDLISNRFSCHRPQVATPAHVVFDPDDPSVFYVSCHNLSKVKSSVALHGPGAIVKYRYKDGVMVELATYTDADFYRITTHQIFKRNNQTLIAITGYPNFLYIIDSDMNLIDKIEIFGTKEKVDSSNVYICGRDSKSPLYLDSSPDGNQVIMTNNDTVFIVNLDDGTVKTGTFASQKCLPTSHIAMV